MTYLFMTVKVGDVALIGEVIGNDSLTQLITMIVVYLVI